MRCDARWQGRIRSPSGISVLQVGVAVTLMRSCPVLLRDGGLEANAAVGWVGVQVRGQPSGSQAVGMCRTGRIAALLCQPTMSMKPLSRHALVYS